MADNYYDENRQKEIMESLSREKILNESELYKSEELPAYESFANALLRNISMPENDMTTLDIRNLDDYLRRQAEKLGLSDDRNINYTIRQIKGFSKKIYKMRKGIQGEQVAKRAIFGINDPKQTLSNLEFTMDDLAFEIDNIIVHEKGVSLVEVKNIRQNLLINENGTLVDADNSKPIQCTNVRTQLNNAAAVIRRVLKQSFPDNPKLLSLADNIHTILFTAGGTIIDSRHEITIANRDNIVRILNNIPSKETLSRDEINMVANAIKKAAQRNQYPLNYDYTWVAQAFSIAIAKLEYAAAHEGGENDANCTDDFNNDGKSPCIAPEKKHHGGQIAAVLGSAALGVGLLFYKKSILTK